jgi:hypothetical protein
MLNFTADAPRLVAKFCMIAIIFFTLTGCEREKRDLRIDPPVESALDGVQVMPIGIGGDSAAKQVNTSATTASRMNAKSRNSLFARVLRSDVPILSMVLDSVSKANLRANPGYRARLRPCCRGTFEVRSGTALGY